MHRANHGPDDFHLYSSSGVNVTSPIHIAAVANSNSVPATVMVATWTASRFRSHKTQSNPAFPVSTVQQSVLFTVTAWNASGFGASGDQNNNKFATPEEAFTVVAAPQQD